MIDLEMGEISLERNEDDRATRRDDAGGLNDDAETNNVSKEKSRESEKHRSKDGSKAKREDRDHGSKGRERSKERVSEDYTARDSDRYDARDRDRSESGRDRRKEERSQYGKHRDHDKDRDKERSRDRVREEEHNRDKYREKDRGKDLGRERERSTDREYERSRDHGKSRGRERENDSEIEKEREMVRDHDMAKDRDHDRSKTRDRESERERRKEINIEKGKDNKNREKEKDRDRTKDKEREKTKDREKDRDRDWEKERDKSKEKLREKEIDRSVESDRVKPRTKDRENWAAGAKESEKDDRIQSNIEIDRLDAREEEASWNEIDTHEMSKHKNQQTEKLAEFPSTSVLETKITKMKEERTKKKSDGDSDILAWVSKSRKLEEKKNAEKEALRLSKVFEEQDNLLAESDDEEPAGNTQNLAGVKILHGLDKVIEGGAVVLTLKDQDILRDGDVNDEIDMLENVEIGEQKMRDAAYNASKKRTGLYDDKFSDQSGPQRAILPQYDDPMEDEGISLDEGGRFTGEAEKKLAELRKRIEGGGSVQKGFEDLRASAKITSDYYTPEELLQFKKPKKKKSLRKKEKLDLDAMEAEAVSAGLGASDRGSRTDSRRQAAKEEKEKIEVEIRNRAYQAAYDKAEAASKILRHEQTLTFKSTEDEDFVFGEEYEDLQRSLEQERKLAHRKQDETAASGLQAVALRATSSKEQEHSQSQYTGEPQEEKVVITEVEEFVLGLQLTQGAQKPESEDVFMDDDDSPISLDTETKGDDVGWTQVEETTKAEVSDNENTDDASPDEIIHEVAVGKGLSGALKLLKERGALKETIDWGGRTMDKKKSKLVGIYDNEGAKEIRIERTDEFGRIMTPKEAFRMLSHKFHGKGPGKMKQEKRMKQYHEDLKTKQMKASDTPLHAVEKMREAQAQLKTPYLVLSGHVKPGQTSDPRSGFATVEKDHLGSLTPMLGDKKVEHFLGIKRKPDMGSMGPPPPKKSKS
ncbi:SART-1 family protein DOT2-like [Zingiber officinale]|uniref:SART-1 family protein DOT2-like n=1 Tax=Zingiber officinale TaxID=94328 RepID=UPI001C4CB830|nr:SART-1 family protein DOT2-like [Zingiber officinale]XP_042419035.1 SART-1 family protein DOT2-like [Zingiber officinale]